MSRYHLVMGALLLLPVLRDGWPASKALLILTVSAATHALIDRRWPVRALLRMAGSPGFATVDWGVIAVDQALHLAMLAVTTTPHRDCCPPEGQPVIAAQDWLTSLAHDDLGLEQAYRIRQTGTSYIEPGSPWQNP